MPLLLLSQEDVERLFDAATMLDVLAQGFADLSSGNVVAPGRSGLQTPDGFFATMPGWRAGGPIGVKLVSAFHENPARGLPGHQAVICLFDPETGTPLAVMDGTHITALRTAGGAALSARLLARPDVYLAGDHRRRGAGGRPRAFDATGARCHRHPRVVALGGERGPRGGGRHPRARGEQRGRGGARRRYRVSLHECPGTAGARRLDRAEGHVTSVGFNPPGGEIDSALLDRGLSSSKATTRFSRRRSAARNWKAVIPRAGPSWARSFSVSVQGVGRRKRSRSTSRWGMRWRTW